MSNDTTIHDGSGNVFADLGIENADEYMANELLEAGARLSRRNLRGIGEHLEADRRLDSLGEDDEFAEQSVVE